MSSNATSDYLHNLKTDTQLNTEMDKQRDVYRQLILTLFKQNFDSSLFLEKRDEMMNESDFETIRNEIEEEYYEKNHGIAPYINAIKYLRAKIEACTAAQSLFRAIEDYLCAKENIIITKMAKVVPAYDEPQKVKKVKRTMQKSKEKQKETSQAHAECQSPYPCKKCRIMHRSDDVKPKPRQQKPKKVKGAAKKSVIKTEPSKSQYSDISDSETTANSSINSTESMPADAVVKSEERPTYQLPYHDHQYSCISFYGNGMGEDSSKADETKSSNPPIEPKANTQTALKTNKHTVKHLLKSTSSPKSIPNSLPSTFPYRFKQNNGLQQPSPVCFVQHSISTTSTVTTVQASTTVYRPIPRPIPQPHPSVFVTSPIGFGAPVMMLNRPVHQGSVIRQPIYYIRLCEQPQHQFFPNNLL